MQRNPPDTDRLSFRVWEPTDLNCLDAICSDPQVMAFVGEGHVWTRERTWQFIQSAIDTWHEFGYCQWAVIHKADHALIGFCGFVHRTAEPEIGWRFAPTYWGQGLATEAARAVLKHGLMTRGFPRVTATVQSANAASIRVIEKLDMKLLRSFQRAGREIRVYGIESE